MDTKTIILTRTADKKHSVVYANKEEGISGFYIPREIVGEHPPTRIEMILRDVAERETR